MKQVLSFRDWAAERTNFPREVAEAALAHVVGDCTEAAYRRGDLFEKRRYGCLGGAMCGRVGFAAQMMIDGLSLGMHMKTNDATSLRFWKLLEEIKPGIDSAGVYKPDFTDPTQLFGIALNLTLIPGDPRDDAIALAFAKTGLNVNDPFHWKLLLTLFCVAHFADWPKVAAPKLWTRARLEQLHKHVTEIRIRHPGLSDAAIAKILRKNRSYRETYGQHSIDYIRERIRDAKKSELEFEELVQKHVKAVQLRYESVGVKWTSELESKTKSSFIEFARKKSEES
jgi:hypothetical protein